MRIEGRIKKRIYNIIESVHKRLFGYNISPEAYFFLRDISWSFMGGIISGFVLLAINILVGRLLGPVEYGGIAIMVAISQIVIIFVCFGMDRASMRFIAMQTSKDRKADHISTTLYVIVTTSIVWTFIFVFIYPFISKLIKIESALILVGIIYGLVLSYRQVMENIIRGLGKFKLQARIRIIESVSILLIFFIFWKLFDLSKATIYMIIPISVGVTFVIFYLYNVRHYLVPFSVRSFKEQFSFGSLYLVAAIFGIFFNSLDKFLIGSYLSLGELGIYSAYFTASVGTMAQLNTIFGNVFTTIVARNLNYLPSIIRKVDKIIFLGFIPLLIFSFVSVSVVIKLFGTSYEFRWTYALIFSLLAVLISIYSINASIAQTYSRVVFKRIFHFGNITNFIFICAYILIILYFGLSIIWVASMLVVYNFILIIICKYVLFKEGAYGIG